jgi:hypothetical protein
MSTRWTVQLVAVCCLTCDAWAGSSQITGQVLDRTTLLPVAGICAEAYGLTTGESTSAPTGSDGVYTIAGLSPDTFQLIAYDCSPPVDHALVEYRTRNRSLLGAHDSPDGARLLHIRRDGQTKRVNFRTPVAGRIAVTVVHDATSLPVADVIVRPIVHPQPVRGSVVLSGFFGTTDANGQVTVDVDPGESTLYAISGHSTDYVVGPVVEVDAGAVQTAEIRVPW